METRLCNQLHYLLHLLLLCSTVSTLPALDQHTEISATKQSKILNTKEELKLNTTPPRVRPHIPYHFFTGVSHFTQSGVKCFLKHTFNHPGYADLFFPFNLSHVLKCLRFAPKTAEPLRYCESVFNLFMLKVLQAPCLNAQALLLFLQGLHPALAQQFDEDQQKTSLERDIERRLYNFYLKRFEALKKDPKNEIKKQSRILANMFKRHSRTRQSLQGSIYTFLITSINQLLWSPEDGEKTWKSIRDIALELTLLHQKGIIQSERHLDDLYWALILRFCYFLQLAGTHIKQEDLEAMAQDLAENDSPLWLIDEREQYITTKKDTLQQAIIHGLVAKCALEEGLIADSVS